MMGRYVQVDETTHYITNGPFLWDGETEVDFGPGTVMLEADALDQGYEWAPPPPEDPEDAGDGGEGNGGQ